MVVKQSVSRWSPHSTSGSDPVKWRDMLQNANGDVVVGSVMAVPAMEADENVRILGLSQQDEIEAFWCCKPVLEADPGASPYE